MNAVEKAIIYDLIIVPTFFNHTNQIFIELEKKILRRELIRYKEFAYIALNAVDMYLYHGVVNYMPFNNTFFSAGDIVIKAGGAAAMFAGALLQRYSGADGPLDARGLHDGHMPQPRRACPRKGF